MPHELSKYVYAILLHGQVVIATLDDDQNPLSSQTQITQLVTGHGYNVAMVFPATPENYEALQVLYEGHGVPPVPLEPKDIVMGLLKQQPIVLVKTSAFSYDDARQKSIARVIAIKSTQQWGSVSGSYKHMVPYDVHGNEITEIPCDTP